MGSVLIGSKLDILKARRIRKAMGGGMRQAGFAAAAGIYALDNNIQRLNEDHQKAKHLSALLEKLAFIDEIFPVETNIIIMKLGYQKDRDEFINELNENGVKVVPFGPKLVRMTLHLDVTESMMDRLTKILNGFKK